MTRSLPSLSHRRRAASAIELAFVLPLLLLLGMGCVDVGRALSAHIAVSNAARVGADYAATHRVTSFTRSSWDAQIESDARAEMAGVHQFDAGQFTVTTGQVPLADGTTRVTVSSRYILNTIISWPGLPTEYELKHTVVARQYR